MAKKWIKKALSKPGSKGALHRKLKIPAGQKIPAAKLDAAAHSSNLQERRRALLAKTLKHFK